VAGRITVAPLRSPRFDPLATLTRAVPDETAGDTTDPPWRICDDPAPSLCIVNTGGCAPVKLFDETTGWPIALRAVGAAVIIAPAWLRDAFPRLMVFKLGLMVRVCCCGPPCRGSTGGATTGSALIGTSALLGAGFARALFPLRPFPLAPLLAVPARAPRCAWPSLAKHGFAASASSTTDKRNGRTVIFIVKRRPGHSVASVRGRSWAEWDSFDPRTTSSAPERRRAGRLAQ
jgi:hypothetical protein